VSGMLVGRELGRGSGSRGSVISRFCALPRHLSVAGGRQRRMVIVDERLAFFGHFGRR